MLSLAHQVESLYGITYYYGHYGLVIIVIP